MKKIFPFLFAFILVADLLSAQAPKKVILEDFTGAWCGFCPWGLTVSNTVENMYPNIIALGMHEGIPSMDSMATPYSNTIANYIAGSYPKGGIDRVKFPGELSVTVSPNDWVSYSSSRLNASSPLNVFISSTFNQATRVVNITVTADFVAGATGDLRMNCLLVEDSVTGVGSGYDQHNYFGSACTFPEPTNYWYNFPCLMPRYAHRHLVRAQLANDPWGESGIIPDPAVSGQAYVKTFSYTVPVTWNENKMEIVAFVSMYGITDDLLYILNSNNVELGGTVAGIGNTNGAATISQLDQNFPNPFSDNTNLHFTLSGSDLVTLRIYDVLGNEITTIVNEKLSGGDYNYLWNGSNHEGNSVKGGMYFYRLITSTRFFTGQMTYIRN